MQNKVFASKLDELEAEHPFQNYDFFREDASNEKNTSETLEEEPYEGQLAVDVYQDKKNIYVRAAIAGVRGEDILIHLNNDTLTLKGKRRIEHEADEKDYFVRECYWGNFSRSIILPVDVRQDQVHATIHHGILIIVLLKSKRPRHSTIPVKEIKE